MLSIDEFHRDVLVNCIKDGKTTQADVAVCYREALIETSPEFPWSSVNGEILQRWSVSGLEKIKKIAWS